ncbi:PASTA domain-containing protein [Streptomyces sp. NPDC006733]|uniref:PASTA domain-containing protein n=1 Tax=Streptomyces sp. NPDC006733 TaxID=3155460 RepID=UPI0033CD6454
MRVRSKILGGVLTALLATVLSVAGAGTGVAAPAAAAPVAAATPVLFDLGGVYTDGGSARPVISNAGDVLTVDMSSQHRPTASGVVITFDTILITFPDDATYSAKLQAPNIIRWSNGSTWQKLDLVRVPNVNEEKEDAARSILISAGFTIGTVTRKVDFSCRYDRQVSSQSPDGGAFAAPGTAVNLHIGLLAPRGQCR